MNILIFTISLLIVVQLIFLRRYIRFVFFSPVYVYILFSVVSLISTFFYYYFEDNQINIFNFDSKTTVAMFSNTFIYFLYALSSFIWGIIFHYVFSKKEIFKLTESLVKKRQKISKVSNVFLFTTVGIFLFSTALLLIVYSDGFLFRDKYIPEDLGNSFGAILLSIIIFTLVLLLGKLYKRYKYTSISMFSVLILMNVTTGSRRIFIYMLLYLLAIFPYLDNKFKTRIFIVGYILFSILILLYVIQLRHIPEHGLIPYLSFFWEGVSNALDELYFIYYYLFIFGFFGAVFTIQADTVSWGTTIIALNPLPGGLAGWHEIAKEMRVNKYVPYTLYGEVFSMGVVFTGVFFFILGIVFLAFDKYIRKLYLVYDKKYFAFFIFLFLILFVMYSFEYNFRAAFRLLYYVGVIVFIYRCWRGLKKYLP